MVYSGGLSAGWNFIKQLVCVVFETCKFMFALAIKFPDEFGITDWLWTRGTYLVVAIAAALLSGYTFTRKEKRKILGIISSIVSLISATLAFL